MDINYKEFINKETGDINLIDDIKQNVEIILNSNIGEFKQYPKLGLGKEYFLFDNKPDIKKVKAALDYDNIEYENIAVENDYLI